MRAILINPIDKTITEVFYTGDFNDIYPFIGADTFDIVRLDGSDDLFVDDEGLLKPDQSFFMHRDYPQPLAGKALLLGNDGEGETTAAHATLEETIKSVFWATLVRIGIEGSARIHVHLTPASDGRMTIEASLDS